MQTLLIVLIGNNSLSPNILQIMQLFNNVVIETLALGQFTLEDVWRVAGHHVMEYNEDGTSEPADLKVIIHTDYKLWGNNEVGAEIVAAFSKVDIECTVNPRIATGPSGDGDDDIPF